MTAYVQALGLQCHTQWVVLNVKGLCDFRAFLRHFQSGCMLQTGVLQSVSPQPTHRWLSYGMNPAIQHIRPGTALQFRRFFSDNCMPIRLRSGARSGASFHGIYQWAYW